MTTPPVATSGPLDDLDLPPAGGSRAPNRWSERWRRLLAWQASSAPVALLLTAGGLFGPRGLNLLSPAALGSLDPAIPAALAALGVLVGLGVKDRRPVSPRLLAAAGVESGTTMLVVAVGMAALAGLGLVTGLAPSWEIAAICGVCASSSLTLPRGSPLEPLPPAARAAELGALLPILAGGFVLAQLATGSPLAAVSLVVQATGATLALAAAAWLLLLQTSSDIEERVFAVAALLLVGGIADALALSALFGGLVAGIFWRLAGRQSRDTISRDVLFVQQPLVILVLLVAGARTELSPLALTLAAAYLLLRLCAKLVGAVVAARLIGREAPRGLVARLMSPGVFGVALALNALTTAGANGVVVLSAVVVGTVGAELVALVLPPHRAEE